MESRYREFELIGQLSFIRIMSRINSYSISPERRHRCQQLHCNGRRAMRRSLTCPRSMRCTLVTYLRLLSQYIHQHVHSGIGWKVRRHSFPQTSFSFVAKCILSCLDVLRIMVRRAQRPNRIHPRHRIMGQVFPTSMTARGVNIVATCSHQPRTEVDPNRPREDIPA